MLIKLKTQLGEPQHRSVFLFGSCTCTFDDSVMCYRPAVECIGFCTESVLTYFTLESTSVEQ